MSFSRSIRILIVEDDPAIVEMYEDILSQLRNEPGMDLCKEVVAGGLAEAASALDKSCPFHVVILDLKLPATVGGDPEGSAETGLSLLPSLRKRNAYPIPALLVLTGNQRYLIQSLHLNESLHSDFYCVLIREKGTDKEIEGYFREAISAAQRYVDFGVVISGDEDRVWPVVTARELDLIRRVGLADPTFAGVDLEWSHAERKNLGDKEDWTKVLMGHFWHREQSLETRPFFFKLESTMLSSSSVPSAKKLENVLRHIQIKGVSQSSERSLTVTASASLSGSKPVSISGYLRLSSEQVLPTLLQIADDITEQLGALGEVSDLPVKQGDLLWPHHSFAKYDDYYQKLSDADEYLPSRFAERVRSRKEPIWRKWKSAQHGDMHLGNIVVDIQPNTARALLIDSGSMDAGPAGKDFAYLEVALILHLVSSSETVLEVAREIYGGPPASGSPSEDLAINTLQLLRFIRERALRVTTEETYRILLLDQALVQFGSLAYGSYGNKVKRPIDALNLYRTIAKWVEGPEPIGEFL